MADSPSVDMAMDAAAGAATSGTCEVASAAPTGAFSAHPT
jgi:hypothetical protein